MAISGRSVGKDYNIGLYDSNTAQVVDLGDVQDFRATALKHDLKSMRYNDVPIYGYLPDGYRGSFSVLRTNPNLENLHLRLQDIFNSGGNLVSGYINETIHESDGTYTRYQYIGVVFFVTETANVTRDKYLPMSVEWAASDKKAIA